MGQTHQLNIDYQYIFLKRNLMIYDYKAPTDSTFKTKDIDRFNTKEWKNYSKQV